MRLTPLILGLILISPARSGDAGDFRTLFVTRSMAHERLMPFLEEARPDIVQIGQYGAMFHGYADDEKSKGTPMGLPFHGERKVLAYQEDLNRKIRELGLEPVGHFRLVKAYGNWEEKTGFVDYYENRWPEDLLGPKPHPDLLELLQRDREGNPVGVSRYGQGQIAFCLSSPPTRQMFKQMLKAAVDHGVAGVITTYNYHLQCNCPHCRKSFRNWIGRNLSLPKRRELGIEESSAETIGEIRARISGCPDPLTARPLDWVAMRWAAENFKAHYDEIFIEYGRSLDPDLIVAQWNHISHVSNGQERMFLPLDSWGKDETYFWESGGASFVGKKLNLAEGMAGDAWLSCLLIRELGGGKPFVMGKYDGIRMEASMAEGFATGGLGMGRYMRFEHPAGFEALSRYTRFRNENDHLYRGIKSLADTALILPRREVWKGNLAPMDDFRETGQWMLENQVLFDVLSDEDLESERLADRYRTVILPKGVDRGKEGNSDVEEAEFIHGSLIDRSKTDAREEIPAGRFRVKAPWTVRFAAYRNQAGNTVLHFVNYDRDEGTTKEEKGNLPQNERPRPVEGIEVEIRQASKPQAVRLHRPEVEEPVELPFRFVEGSLRFALPEIRVYGVVEIAGGAPSDVVGE